MNSKLAPICLFTYNRLTETIQTIDALKKNFLASESALFVFSDGAKNLDGQGKIAEVRTYISKISGFKSIAIFESPVNKGLANSIISGVSKVIEQYGKVIVLEDDLITSPNFLDFINQALDFYDGNPLIHSVSGYTLDLPILKNYPHDYYFGLRASSWGWGTWKEKWKNIDWEVSNYNEFKKNAFHQIRFMRGGSDMPQMLRNQMKGRIDSWAIRWCFDQFQKHQLTVFPVKSKVYSIGYGDNATHTKKTKRFDTEIDIGGNRIFKFSNEIKMNSRLLKEFKNRFSIYNRLLEKIRNYL